MNKKKNIIIVIILVVILFLVYQFFFLGKKTSSSEKIISPVVKKLSKNISASGKIIAKNQIDLKFQTSGQLVWVGVKEGDHVNAWQSIAQLDKRELEKKLIKSLRDYSKSRWDFEQDKNDTYEGQILTDTIKRILEKNQFDLDKSVADVEIADIALKFSTLLTPISGIIIHIDIPVAGVNITPSTAVFTVADPESLVFKADIDESDIGNVSENQKVLVVLDAFPDKNIEGKVDKIGFVSETTSGGGNGFPIEMKLPENDGLNYKIGMNGDITITTEEKNNVITLPFNSIKREQKKTYVYVKIGNNKLKKEVKLGMETDDDVEIISGLSQNDKVVLETK